MKKIYILTEDEFTEYEDLKAEKAEIKDTPDDKAEKHYPDGITAGQPFIVGIDRGSGEDLSAAVILSFESDNPTGFKLREISPNINYPLGDARCGFLPDSKCPIHNELMRRRTILEAIKSDGLPFDLYCPKCEEIKATLARLEAETPNESAFVQSNKAAQAMQIPIVNLLRTPDNSLKVCPDCRFAYNANFHQDKYFEKAGHFWCKRCTTSALVEYHQTKITKADYLPLLPEYKTGRLIDAYLYIEQKQKEVQPLDEKVSPDDTSYLTEPKHVLEFDEQDFEKFKDAFQLAEAVLLGAKHTPTEDSTCPKCRLLAYIQGVINLINRRI